MAEYKKPLPYPSAASLPFWQAAKRHELCLQYCADCGAHIFYPREFCSECLSTNITWEQVSGKGTVYSYTVAEVPTHPAFTGDIPYIIAIVTLDEGPRLTTNIIGCAPHEVHVGMTVIVAFDDVTPESTLVKFRPA